MRTLERVTFGRRRSGHAAPSASASGRAASTRGGASRSALWVVDCELGAGSSISWRAGHGDEALIVLDGSLSDVRGLRLGPNDALAVEREARPDLRADAPTRFLHFGGAAPSTPPEPRHGPGGVHRAGAAGRWVSRVARGETTIEVRYYFDSTCPTCEVLLARGRSSAGYHSASHSHSKEEILYVLDGEMRIGGTRVGSGTAVAVPADLRYSFRSGDDGCEFLVFRAEGASYSGHPRDPAVQETALNMGARPVEML